MKMNSYMILGILVLAVGTGLSAYLINLSTVLSSKDSQKEVLNKIEETRQQIVDAKGAPNVDRKEIEKIEDEFNSWADDFVKNKELKKLELEKEDINTKGNRIALNAKWKPHLDAFFSSIKNILDAYNKRTGDNINYNIPQLPDNLFDPAAVEYQATITFRPDIKWSISLTPAAPLADDPMPSLKISIYDSIGNYPQDKIGIAIIDDTKFNQDSRVLIMKHDNNRFNMNNIHRTYNINEDAFKVLAKDLLESQLLQL